MLGLDIVGGRRGHAGKLREPSAADAGLPQLGATRTLGLSVDEAADIERQRPALIFFERPEARHGRPLNAQCNGAVKAIDAAPIQALAIMKVARSRLKARGRRSVAVPLKAVTTHTL